jgi:hypothetical protein
VVAKTGVRALAHSNGSIPNAIVTFFERRIALPTIIASFESFRLEYTAIVKASVCLAVVSDPLVAPRRMTGRTGKTGTISLPNEPSC